MVEYALTILFTGVSWICFCGGVVMLACAYEIVKRGL